jgi:hypothetical protein
MWTWSVHKKRFARPPRRSALGRLGRRRNPSRQAPPPPPSFPLPPPEETAGNRRVLPRKVAARISRLCSRAERFGTWGGGLVG